MWTAKILLIGQKRPRDSWLSALTAIPDLMGEGHKDGCYLPRGFTNVHPDLIQRRVIIVPQGTLFGPEWHEPLRKEEKEGREEGKERKPGSYRFSGGSAACGSSEVQLWGWRLNQPFHRCAIRAGVGINAHIYLDKSLYYEPFEGKKNQSGGAPFPPAAFRSQMRFGACPSSDLVGVIETIRRGCLGLTSPPHIFLPNARHKKRNKWHLHLAQQTKPRE